MTSPIVGHVPIREGTHATDRVGQGAPPPVGEAKPTLLADMARDYRFIQPGLLYTVARLPAGVISEWRAQAEGRECPTMLWADGRALFRGIGPQQLASGAVVPWDRALVAVPVAHAESLVDALRMVTVTDTPGRTLARAFTQEITIRDPAALRRAVVPDPVPRVRVTVIGVDATYGVYDLYDHGDGTPQVRGRPARADTRALAEALFAGNGRPFSVTEEPVSYGPGVRIPQGI